MEAPWAPSFLEWGFVLPYTPGSCTSDWSSQSGIPLTFAVAGRELHAPCSEHPVWLFLRRLLMVRMNSIETRDGD